MKHGGLERLETKQPNVKPSGSDFLCYIPELKTSHKPTNKKHALLKETLNHVLIFFPFIRIKSFVWKLLKLFHKDSHILSSIFTWIQDEEDSFFKSWIWGFIVNQTIYLILGNIFHVGMIICMCCGGIFISIL